jgi:hypothetical protein
MDVSQGPEFFLYAIVAIFAVGAVFVSHSPAAIGDPFRQMQDAIMIGQKGHP